VGCPAGEHSHIAAQAAIIAATAFSRRAPRPARALPICPPRTARAQPRRPLRAAPAALSTLSVIVAISGPSTIFGIFALSILSGFPIAVNRQEQKPSIFKIWRLLLFSFLPLYVCAAKIKLDLRRSRRV
jgi:hypothetical protein